MLSETPNIFCLFNQGSNDFILRAGILQHGRAQHIKA
jgi:hypothetical protein